MHTKEYQRVHRVIGLLLALLLATAAFADARPAHAQVGGTDAFVAHLDLPNGSRIDYIRLYYYDTNSLDSRLFLTSYNASGAFTDHGSADSSGTGGYGYAVSGFIDHVVDTASRAYVLNWLPRRSGATMRLCGARIAYRLPQGAGWSNFRYLFVAGTTMRPRDSKTAWQYRGGGCVSAEPTYAIYIPHVRR